MIPIRLEMKNFLPYRSPDPLRFEGIHLACLTGPNGAGKSSLLDAITWALWGKARARRDEELVHLGQGDMLVQLDFEQEGVTYRVLRRRSRGKRSGQGTLDLFILSVDGGGPVNITEPSMRATQEKLNNLLHLDYETFIHSAFLQQGKADAFTTKTPAERKRILADILGLDRWEHYEDAVKARLTAITDQLRLYEHRIQEIDAELARKPALEANLAEAVRSYEEAQAALQAAEKLLAEVAHAPGELENARQNQADRQRQLRDYQHDLEEVNAQIERQADQLAEYEEIVATREEIEGGYNALLTAREANLSLSDKLQSLRTLEHERAELHNQLTNARTRLESEAASLENHIRELEQASQTDYTEELEGVQAQVEELRAKEIERNQLEERRNERLNERIQLETLQKTITDEGRALRDRLDRLQATDDEAATCPLCGQELDAEHRQQITTQLQDEVEEKRRQYRDNDNRIHTLNQEIAEHKQFIDALETELKQLSPLSERIGKLQSQVESAQQAATRLEEERQRLAKIQQQLTEETYAADLRTRLQALEARQSELDYDQSSHDDARQQLEAHTHFEQLHTRLSFALESMPDLEQSLENARARRDRLTKNYASTEQKLIELESEINRLSVLAEEYRTREAETQAQRTLERSADQRRITALQELNALDAQADRKAQLETRQAEDRQQEALYGELRQAFGKNGVPAMIIETVIPELESIANDLLSRMTDGRMHLRLNTQREKITGGVAETLEIEIADELGTRGYELYSGGESFRVNFALRVALSQLLARRAGAHLRTLFIDEGFGTQDDSGRNKLVEAINAIQDEFSLILIITHIDDLRDSFPVHIAVDKTATGSRFSIY
jgi:DNA repair protein SbcC/Rad50